LSLRFGTVPLSNAMPARIPLAPEPLSGGVGRPFRLLGVAELRYSNWETTRAYREPAGQRRHETRSRTRIQEIRKADHHPSHSFAGFSSRAHTHWSIVRREWTEQSDIITDFDRKQTITPATNRQCQRSGNQKRS
jgi:hypothetical protein